MGKAIAKTFAALGAKVVIASRQYSNSEKLYCRNNLEDQMFYRQQPRKLKKKLEPKLAQFSFANLMLKIQMLSKQPSIILKKGLPYKSLLINAPRTGRLPNIIVNNAAGNFVSATERLSPNAVKVSENDEVQDLLQILGNRRYGHARDHVCHLGDCKTGNQTRRGWNRPLHHYSLC